MDDELVSLQWTLYQSSNPTRRWLHNMRRDWIGQAIRRVGRSGGRALEVGPGSGVYVPDLKAVNSEVYLSDRESIYLDAIERRYKDDRSVNLVVDDITQSALPSEHFDLVLCTEVLEHIRDSRSALKQIARVMKPDGILILSTPQRYSTLELTARLALSPALIWLTRWIYREPVLEMGHINLLTESQLRAQLSEAGLSVLEHHKGGLYLPGIAEALGVAGQQWADRLEPKIRGTRLAGMLWTQYYVIARETHLRGGNA